MKNKIGFLAIGQAGGNIGKLLEDRGYAVLYLNTSKEDLDTLKNVKFKFHIEGGEGCNKDRSKAKRLVVANFEQLEKEIVSKLPASMYYTIFAAGGGTGSGAGPMLTDLLSAERAVGAITILPSSNESVRANINAYECIYELIDIDNICSSFILDNDSENKMAINSIFVDMLCSYLEIPDKHKSERGNIDKAEIVESLRAKGMAIITKLNEKNSSTATLIERFNNNIFADIESDRAIKYISVSTTFDIDMHAIEKEVGVAVDIYETYNKESTICLLSGLSYPVTRLENIHKQIEDKKDIIKKNLDTVSQNRLKEDIDFLNYNANKEEKPTKSKNAIMSKYLRI